MNPPRKRGDPITLLLLKAITALIATAIALCVAMPSVSASELTGNSFAINVTCGTSAGQTPFTITASVASNFNGQNISCNGANDGIATVTVSGGVGPFAYQWVGGPAPVFTQNYSGLGAGTYTVIVTDLGQGISCVDNVQLTEPAQVTVLFFMSSPPSCTGSCDGSATPVTIGGVPPYTFAWGNGETTQSAAALCEGATSLVITDLNGCQYTTTYTAVLDETQINLSTTDVQCNGATTGTASVAPTGGNGGPYTVNWSTGASGTNISGLAAGVYSVSITDANGCVVSQDFTISEEPPVVITIDATQHLLCADINDGSISASAVGGTLDYLFSWAGPSGFAASGAAISNLAEGNYVLTVTDANGCFTTQSVTLTSPPMIEITATVSDVLCNGDAQGSISASASGGVPTYTYQWSGPSGFSATTASLSALTAGSYLLEVTDLNGCTASASLEVQEPAPLSLDATVTDVQCNGQANGSIEATASGGSPTYTYSWSGPGSFAAVSASIQNLAAGTYLLTLLDANGCNETFSFEVTQPDPITISVGIDPITCNANNDATITATVSGGNEPYSYFWTGPHGTSTSSGITNAATGAYNLTVTDANGCQQVATVIVTEPDPLVLVPIVTPTSCGGESDGAIDLTILGGVPDYTVVWSGPGGFSASSTFIDGLSAGTYDVTITDLAGCQTNSAYTVTEVPPMVIEVTPQDLSCNGANDGAIALNISGGQGPFDVSWAGPNLFTATNQNISALAAGTYNVLVVDANGCFEESFAVIIEPAPITFSVVTENLACFGDDTGSITLTMAGGSAPYTVLWNNGDQGEALFGLPAGSYSASLTDDAGCTVNIGPLVLEESPEIVIDATVIDLACPGDTIGAISLNLSGGTGNFDVAWSGPNGFTSNQTSLSALGEGTYNVVVTDDDGCEATFSTTLVAPDAFVINASSTNAVCADDLIDITIVVNGGTSPYQFVWSGPAGFASNEQDLIGVNQGSYTLDLQDDNGCVVQEFYEFTAPDPLLVSGSVTSLDCTGDPIGAIALAVTGGQPPFTFNWTGSTGFNSFDQDISNLAAGLYTLVVIDDLGCEIFMAFTVSAPDPLLLNSDVINPSCSGAANGSINLAAAGGESPYTYSWSGPNGFTATGAAASNLAAGIYTIVVNDSGNCSDTFEITLTEPMPLSLSADVTDVLCGGNASGAIDLAIGGGTAAYQVVWSAPGFSASTAFIDGLVAGSYQADVADANGCTAQAVFTLSQNDSIDLTIDTENSTCGDANGAASANASGGTGTLSYAWLSGASSLGIAPSIANLSSGNYTLQVSDELGCTIALDFSISDSDAIDLDASATHILCADDSNGTIDLTISGGTGALTIEWSGPNSFAASTEDISDLAAATYTVNVTDELLCFASLSIDITQPDALDITVDVTSVSCNADADGSIEAQVSGGTPPYTFAWSGPSGFIASSATLSDLAAGTYNLTLTDANFCVLTTEVIVLQASAIDVAFTVTDVACGGDATGAIDTEIVQATAPYDVLWIGPGGFNTTTLSIDALVAGNYSVTINDASGCVAETTITVNEAAIIQLDVEQNQPTCNSSNGSLTVTITGGSGTYAVFWYDLDNGNALIGTDEVLANIPSGNYFLEVLDDAGCAVSQNFVLSDATGDLDAELSQVTCNGNADGSITVTVSGAVPPFTYAWTGPAGFSATTANIENLNPGDYTLQVDDAAGCTLLAIYTVNEPEVLSVATQSTDALCNGNANGTVMASATGGTTPYSFAWSGQNGFTSADQDIADLPAGCYNLTVTDANGCQTSDQACVDEPAAIDVQFIVTSIACNGESTGSIETQPTGGEGTLSFAWNASNGFTSTDQSLFGIAAGTYTLTVNDDGNCAVDYDVEVAENLAVQAEINPTLPGCPGESNGALALALTGGVAPYTVNWFDESGEALGAGLQLGGLPAGVYTFTAADAFGCQTEGEAELLEPDAMEVTATVIGVSCTGLNNGQITPTINGGAPPYSTFWIGPNGFQSTAHEVTGLAPGTYQLTVGDINACSVQVTFVIEEPIGLEVSIENIVFTSCLNSLDGAISADAAGGTAPYTYIWTGPNGFTAEGADLIDIGIGSYNLTVTDVNGCSNTINNIPIIHLGDVTAFAGDDQEFCFGAPLQLEGSNTGSNSSGWFDEEGNPLSNNDVYTTLLEPGSYVFIYSATDGGCTHTDTLEVVVFELPFLNPGADRSVYPETSVTLGGSPTTNSENLISWSPSDLLSDDDVPNPTTVPLTATTTFFAEVIDVNGCGATDSVTVTVIPRIDVPSGFTPNGDGMNDAWIIANADEYPNMIVEVYNRWGEMLYRADRGYIRPWDGTYNGNPVPIGTYYYVIEIKEPNFGATMNGPLTILR